MNFDDLVRKYVRIRDAKAELMAAQKEEVARFDNALAKIEEMILAEFNETGQESAKTKHGTAYKSTKTSTKVADRDAFLAFVRDTEAWDFIESRANKKAVDEYMEEHEELPPGVDVSRVTTINIRRS